MGCPPSFFWYQGATLELPPTDPQLPSPRGDRRGVAALSLLAVLASTPLFFSDLLFERQLPVFRDLLVFGIPFKQFYATRIATGTLPLWNPWINLGFPFLASLQTGVFYPPSLLLLIPLPEGLNFFILFHYLVAIAGMWLWTRRRGFSPAACAVGALTFAFGGYLVSMLNVLNHLQAAVWAPWVLLVWERCVARRSFGRWLALTLVIAMQILAGAPETSLMTLTIAAAETPWLSGERAAKIFAMFLLPAAALAAAGLTAVQLVPTAEYIGESARGSALRYVEVMSWSLQPVSLLEFLFPHGSALGPGSSPGDLCPMFERPPPWISSIYVGLAPLCLAFAGAAFGRERWLWLGASLISVLLALGDHLPLLPALYAWFPALFGRFRFPEKFLFVVHLALAMLAASGADRVFARDRRAERFAFIGIGTLGVVAAATLATRFFTPEEYLRGIVTLSGGFRGAGALAALAESVAFRAERAVMILVAFLGLLLLSRRALVRRAMIAATVAGLAAFDLGSVHYNLNLAIPWSELREPPTFVDFAELRRDDHRLFHYQTTTAAFPGQPSEPVRGLEHLSRFEWRADSVRELFRGGWRARAFNAPIFEETGTLSGSDGIQRNSENMLGEALSLPFRHQSVQLLRAYSVRYLIGPTPIEVASAHPVPTAADLPFHVYRLDGVAPRAYLARAVTTAGSDLDAFNRMIAADFRPGIDAVSSDAVPSLACDESERSRDRVAIVERGDDRLRLETESSCPSSLLVVNDAFYPGWTAAIDGREAPILRTNVLVRGIVVPEGRHEVTLAYRPASFRAGATISLATALLLAAAALVSARIGGRPR